MTAADEVVFLILHGWVCCLQDIAPVSISTEIFRHACWWVFVQSANVHLRAMANHLSAAGKLSLMTWWLPFLTQKGWRRPTILKPSMVPLWKTASGQRLPDLAAEAINAYHVHQGCYFILSCCIFIRLLGCCQKHCMWCSLLQLPACATCMYHLPVQTVYLCVQHQYASILMTTRIDAYCCLFCGNPTRHFDRLLRLCGQFCSCCSLQDLATTWFEDCRRSSS